MASSTTLVCGIGIPVAVAVLIGITWWYVRQRRSREEAAKAKNAVALNAPVHAVKIDDETTTATSYAAYSSTNGPPRSAPTGRSVPAAKPTARTQMYAAKPSVSKARPTRTTTSSGSGSVYSTGWNSGGGFGSGYGGESGGYGGGGESGGGGGGCGDGGGGGGCGDGGGGGGGGDGGGGGGGGGGGD